MIVVWYDPDCDEIWITDEGRSYARRSLVAYIAPDGVRIGIHLKEGTAADIVMASYGNLCRKDGSAFGSAAEAKAYLDGEFARQRALDIPTALAVAAADIPAGMPVAVSRRDGTLQIARADTYTLAFVAGLASKSAAVGSAGSATRNAITLADWTAVTGSPGLAVGQPYFLAPEGGLTPLPPVLPGLCSVRVGNATGPQTFAPIEADPILL